MNSRSLLLLGTLISLLSACVSETTLPREQCQAAVIPVVTGDTVRTASGLRYINVALGDTTSLVPTGADTVGLHFDGFLPAGRIFASTASTGPEEFSLGEVIPGFAEGIRGMHVNGVRRLIVPPALGYGAQAVGCIPGNSTLIFDVELLFVRPVKTGTP